MSIVDPTRLSRRTEHNNIARYMGIFPLRSLTRIGPPILGAAPFYLYRAHQEVVRKHVPVRGALNKPSEIYVYKVAGAREAPQKRRLLRLLTHIITKGPFSRALLAESEKHRKNYIYIYIYIERERERERERASE
jgi:hypothetical protein